jgi:nicotinamide mononucleotide (NMN) deamidase PncC
MTVRLPLLALGLGVAALGACGESKLDTSRLESQIKETLSKRTGIAITSVACPGDVKAEAGDVFYCTAKAARNERVVVRVRQDDAEGKVTWRIAPPRSAGR